MFGGISEEILEFLVELTPCLSVPRGSYFFREGDRAISMFVLEAGRVNILKIRNGHVCSLGFLDKGDCFGEMALIDLFPRSVSVLAEENCRAIEISSATLYAVYERGLEQFTLIQMNLARELSRRLRKADEQLFQLREAESLGDKVSYSV